jgi:excisionase family DNA binding protein
MQVITIQTEAFQQIIDKLDAISKNQNGDKGKANKLSDNWLTIDQTCKLLNISRRTLQAYRDDGILPFSQYLNKIYFKASDIEAHLQRNYKPAYNK